MTTSFLIVPLYLDLIFSQKFQPWQCCAVGGQLLRDLQPSEVASWAGGVLGTWVVDLRSMNPGGLTHYHNVSLLFFIVVPHVEKFNSVRIIKY